MAHDKDLLIMFMATIQFPFLFPNLKHSDKPNTIQVSLQSNTYNHHFSSQGLFFFPISQLNSPNILLFLN